MIKGCRWVDHLKNKKRKRNNKRNWMICKKGGVGYE